MPLVNELVIGLPDKDKFNASKPRHDAQFLNYVTNPSLPVLLNALFGNAAMIPANPAQRLGRSISDRRQGHQSTHQGQSERNAALEYCDRADAGRSQNDLGVLGGDLAGFPNGRRPYDDVVDITLRVAEGALCGAIGNCGAETERSQSRHSVHRRRARLRPGHRARSCQRRNQCGGYLLERLPVLADADPRLAERS